MNTESQTDRITQLEAQLQDSDALVRSNIEQRRELEASCAAMRETLRELATRMQGHGWGSCGTFSISTAQLYGSDLTNIQKAISTDAGKSLLDRLQAAEAERDLAIKLLREARGFTIYKVPELWWTKCTELLQSPQPTKEQ